MSRFETVPSPSKTELHRYLKEHPEVQKSYLDAQYRAALDIHYHGRIRKARKAAMKEPPITLFPEGNYAETFRVRVTARAKNGNLAAARERLGLTQKALAELLGISQYNYGKIENMRYYPNLELQKRICDFYRTRGIHILEEDVFPDELKDVKAQKMIAEKEIPREQLLSLSGMSQKALPVAESADMIFEREELQRIIDSSLESLSAKERQILKLSFGLEDGEERTDEEIGQVYNVSGSNIYYIRHKALRKLRHPGRGRRLKVFLEE